jgi:hypothetical protein
LAASNFFLWACQSFAHKCGRVSHLRTSLMTSRVIQNRDVRTSDLGSPEQSFHFWSSKRRLGHSYTRRCNDNHGLASIGTGVRLVRWVWPHTDNGGIRANDFSQTYVPALRNNVPVDRCRAAAGQCGPGADCWHTVVNIEK